MEGKIKDIALEIVKRKQIHICQIIGCGNINTSVNSCVCVEHRKQGLKAIDVQGQICIDGNFRVNNTLNTLEFKCGYCSSWYQTKSNKYLNKIINSDILCCDKCQRIICANNNLKKINKNNHIKPQFNVTNLDIINGRYGKTFNCGSNPLIIEPAISSNIFISKYIDNENFEEIFYKRYLRLCK